MVDRPGIWAGIFTSAVRLHAAPLSCKARCIAQPAVETQAQGVCLWELPVPEHSWEALGAPGIWPSSFALP